MTSRSKGTVIQEKASSCCNLLSNTAGSRNLEFKYYRLTDKGKKQPVVEESQWKQMAEAVARVMWPAAEES
jgi:DNA-binding PadR family transcriptional regulator